MRDGSGKSVGVNGVVNVTDHHCGVQSSEFLALTDRRMIMR